MNSLEQIRDCASRIRQPEAPFREIIREFADLLKEFVPESYKDIMFPVTYSNEDLVAKGPVLTDGELHVTLYDMWREHAETIKASATRDIARETVCNIADAVEAWEASMEAKRKEGKHLSWVNRQLQKAETRHQKKS